VVDATGNYRLIWLFPAATGVAHAIVNCWLRFPAKRATDPDMITKLWQWSIVQTEAMAETGIVTGLLAAPLLGEVTTEDADSAVVVDMARRILGNPYEDESESSSDGPGSVLELVAEGGQADEALDALCELVGARFEEDE